jgi:hypothetical protein
MNGFDFLFSFQSLLLGLAVARVATGFADMWRGRKDMVVGISPILLGLLILFSAAHQWMSAWEARSVVTMGAWPILVSIGITLPYVFVSQAMLPREQDTWASLEDYYMAHGRVLVGVLLLPPVISLSYNFARGNFLVTRMLTSWPPLWFDWAFQCYLLAGSNDWFTVLGWRR